MAVLVYSELSTAFLDEIGANAATDAPLSSTEIARYLNDAYADVWELSGGSVKNVDSATAWTSAQTATGVVTGILTDIREVIHVYASTTSGSVGVTSGDNVLDRVELSQVEFFRHSNVTGTYDRPKIYALSRIATTTPASVNLMQLNYWPSVTGYYFPIKYIPQFTPIDSVTVTTPDVDDIGSRDIYLLAAFRAAPAVGNAHLVPTIASRFSQRLSEWMTRKDSAAVSGDQNR